MPDKRVHRGQHPRDARSFAPEMHQRLRFATSDLSWMLTRDYAQPSALKVVGDRYGLTARQRMAVMRAACSDQALTLRKSTEAGADPVADQPLMLDGYNVLTTIEAALSDGILLLCRDGTMRDVASIHGTWRKVEETAPALELAARSTTELRVAQCTWFLDSPVSNSGRLKTLILDLARQRGWNWQAEIVTNPDVVLIETNDIIASADSFVLDHCRQWFNFARYVVSGHVADATVVDLQV